MTIPAFGPVVSPGAYVRHVTCGTDIRLQPKGRYKDIEAAALHPYCPKCERFLSVTELSAQSPFKAVRIER